jgi:ATP synthase protein I
VGMRSYRRPGRYATSGAPGAAASSGSAAGAAGTDDELTMGTGWSVFSYLISGLLAYGGIGWVIAHFTHVSLFFPIGMLIGLGISTGWIVYKYGRPHQQGNPPKGDDR